MSVRVTPCRSRVWLTAIPALTILLSVAPVQGSPAQVAPESVKYHWNLAHIYKDEAAWKRDFEELKGYQGRMEKHKGSLSTSAARLLEALTLCDRINLLGHRLQSWTEKRVQEDGRDPGRKVLVEQLALVTSGLDAEQSFLEAEILALEPSRLRGFLDSEPGLKPYRPYVEDLLRLRPHRLHAEAEALLALGKDVLGASQSTYHGIKKDMVFEPVRDAAGQLTPAKPNYLALAMSPDARVRRDVHASRLSGYGAHLQGLGASLASEMKRDVFLARARRMETCLEGALLEEGVPTEVFLNFIKVVKGNTGALQRWMNIRKRLLGVDDLQRGDLFVPLPIPGTTPKEYPYDETVKLAETALAPQGESYLNLFRSALSQGWVDVFPAPGKDPWPGSASVVYGVHPYVLLNWDKSLFAARTLVHEMGHAINLHHMAQDEPFLYQRWWLCSSEVASTCNEILLIEHMLAKAGDKPAKLDLLADELERMTHLLFGLGLQSEFELVVHTQVEKGGDLSTDWLRKTYRVLAQSYYGSSVSMVPLDDAQGILDLLDNHWGTCYARYVYALGYCASQDFAKRLIDGEPGIQATYRRFLGRGRAHYPIEALREAGVDFTTAKPFERTLQDFAIKVEQFERLLNE